MNERLRDSTNKANRYANLLMPINANIGWISYALVAIVGAVLGINGLAGVTIGTVVTFVGLNKSFTKPHYPGQPADQFRRQRRRRSPEGIRPHGSDAGSGRRLCGTCQRSGGREWKPHRISGENESVGLGNILIKGRGNRYLYQTGRRRCI